jgi:hypothetical protein
LTRLRPVVPTKRPITSLMTDDGNPDKAAIAASFLGTLGCIDIPLLITTSPLFSN